MFDVCSIVLHNCLGKLGRPLGLPIFRVELPLASNSIILKRLLSPLLDHPLDVNALNNLIELHFWMTLNGSTTLYCTNDAYVRAHWKFEKKIDPYYKRQKCSPGTLLSGGIIFMWIFVRVPWWGDTNDSGLVRPAILIISVDLSSEPWVETNITRRHEVPYRISWLWNARVNPLETHRKLNPILVSASTNDEIFY